MFENRKDAGRKLADKLARYKDGRDVLVLALPRGGVATGFEIARRLNVPLDVLIVRKIGFPGQPELAVGAVSETGSVAVNAFIVEEGGLEDYVKAETERQKKEIARRVALFRHGGRPVPAEGKTVIVVDDGVATGATMKAALMTLRQEKVKRLVVAVPVSPPETARELEEMADEFVCLMTPPDFMAVGGYYYDFTQVEDEEVVKMLDEMQREKSESRR